MCLGVFYDLVGIVFLLIFKVFIEVWLLVELIIVCGILFVFVECIVCGELDVVVVEVFVDEVMGECFCVECLVWVGLCGGNVYVKCLLLLLMVDESCVFCVCVFKVLGEYGIEWCMVFESGNIEVIIVMVCMGLVVMVWLMLMVLVDFDIFGFEVGLLELLMFVISLLLFV